MLYGLVHMTWDLYFKFRSNLVNTERVFVSCGGARVISIHDIHNLQKQLYLLCNVAH